MHIQALLAELMCAPLSDAVCDVNVETLTLDSRLVRSGDVFVTLRGKTHNGEEYISQAFESGAVAVFCDAEFDASELPKSLQQKCVHVHDLRRVLGMIAAKLNNKPTEFMRVVGVTGTDGKTSTAHFIAQLIAACGMLSGQQVGTDDVAVMGTVGNGSLQGLSPATHTTPDAVSLQNYFAQFKEQGIQAVAMEVSSHALDQSRVSGVKFDVAVLTNLARDHMDYHHCMREYANAKSKLFHMDGLRATVINGDDDFGCALLDKIQPNMAVYCYGFDEDLPNINARQGGQLKGANLVCDESGLSFDVTFKHQKAQVRCSVIGAFNAHNVMAAMATLLAFNVPFNHVVTAVQKLKPVSGRMQLLQTEQHEQPMVIVDYAHTPQALGAVLDATRAHIDEQAKLFCVFGCGGDRDAGKRALMGEIATHGSDVVVLTDDNPRTEDPQAIFDDVLSGQLNAATPMECIHNRQDAIKYVVSRAQKGDAILIAGKGHENYQIIGTEKIEFCDVMVAQNALSNRTKNNVGVGAC